MRGLAPARPSRYALGTLRADREGYVAKARRTGLSTLLRPRSVFDAGLTRPGARGRICPAPGTEHLPRVPKMSPEGHERPGCQGGDNAGRYKEVLRADPLVSLHPGWPLPCGS